VRIIGVDTGGTFTDFVVWEQGSLRVHKLLSTPHAPEQAILQGIAELALPPDGLVVVHGSTVATNAVLEGKGVRTLFITNRGFGDLLTIGRQARCDLYDLQPPPVPPPVPSELCWEIGGRLAADGSLVEPLTAEDLAELCRAVARLQPEAVAINLLFSYLDEGPERAIAAALPAGLFVSRSSEVLPVAGEYERGIATWLNAWVGPLVAGYLGRLCCALPGARVSVMQSSGETVAAEQAADQAVRLLLSGPAGGLVGARFAAGQSGQERLLSFDMGGTSTDVALIEGVPQLTREGRIGGYPVAVPMVDMHTIGAGGGSIARLDAGGLLLVGPESAGADPGPACYGRGGREPTVTDANLVLGRLRPERFLGGRMPLDAEAARRALRRLAQRMGCGLEEVAAGVLAVADEHMARALRVISVERGVDPRGHTLVSFGGAGGLHVCALAEALGMRRALVPVHAGVLSALGMLVTRPGRLLTRTWLCALETLDDVEVNRQLEALVEQGAASLAAEGVERGHLEAVFSLDLRYRGQAYTLNLPWLGRSATLEAFHARHEQRYGHRLDLPMELVNLRVSLAAPAPAVTLAAAPSQAAPMRQAHVHGFSAPIPLVDRAALGVGAPLLGPAVITDADATTWLAPGWIAWRDGIGNVQLERD